MPIIPIQFCKQRKLYCDKTVQRGYVRGRNSTFDNSRQMSHRKTPGPVEIPVISASSINSC